MSIHHNRNSKILKEFLILVKEGEQQRSPFLAKTDILLPLLEQLVVHPSGSLPILLDGKIMIQEQNEYSNMVEEEEDDMIEELWEKVWQPVNPTTDEYPGSLCICHALMPHVKDVFVPKKASKKDQMKDESLLEIGALLLGFLAIYILPRISAETLDTLSSPQLPDFYTTVIAEFNESSSFHVQLGVLIYLTKLLHPDSSIPSSRVLEILADEHASHLFCQKLVHIVENPNRLDSIAILLIARACHASSSFCHILSQSCSNGFLKSLAKNLGELGIAVLFQSLQILCILAQQDPSIYQSLFSEENRDSVWDLVYFHTSNLFLNASANPRNPGYLLFRKQQDAILEFWGAVQIDQSVIDRLICDMDQTPLNLFHFHFLHVFLVRDESCKTRVIELFVSMFQSASLESDIKRIFSQSSRGEDTWRMLHLKCAIRFFKKLKQDHGDALLDIDCFVKLVSLCQVIVRDGVLNIETTKRRSRSVVLALEFLDALLNLLPDSKSAINWTGIYDEFQLYSRDQPRSQWEIICFAAICGKYGNLDYCDELLVSISLEAAQSIRPFVQRCSRYLVTLAAAQDRTISPPRHQIMVRSTFDSSDLSSPVSSTKVTEREGRKITVASTPAQLHDSIASSLEPPTPLPFSSLKKWRNTPTGTVTKKGGNPSRKTASKDPDTTVTTASRINQLQEEFEQLALHSHQNIQFQRRVFEEKLACQFQDIEELREELACAHQTILTLRGEAESWNKEREDLMHFQQSLASEKESLKVEFKDLHRLSAVQTMELSERERKIQHLTDELRASQASQQDAEAIHLQECNHYKQAVSELEGEKSRLSVKLGKVHKNYELMVKHSSELEARVQDLEQELTSREDENDELVGQLQANLQLLSRKGRTRERKEPLQPSSISRSILNAQIN